MSRRSDRTSPFDAHAVPPLDANSVRELDRRAIHDYGMSGQLLMENAGRGVVDICLAQNLAPPFVIVCGKGNNGGDGMVVARRLDMLGAEVRIVLLATPGDLQGDAAAMCRIAQFADLDIRALPDWDAAAFAEAMQGAGCVIDAILGTGSRGAPRSPAAEAIEAINAQTAPVLAVDIPSGLDCDTGQRAGAAVKAAHTCTFVAPKPGLLITAAAPYVGELHVVDIGVPRRLLNEFFPAPTLWPAG